MGLLPKAVRALLPQERGLADGLAGGQVGGFEACRLQKVWCFDESHAQH